ncbi:MAG: sugar phosphate nucleotidyltransferase, partial [Kangiellaceae bacterium]
EIMLEPVGKNTAPAVLLSALYSIQRDEDPLLLILPADHMINDVQQFKLAIESSVELANNGQLVTFGIVPEYASTQYGYIQRDDLNSGSDRFESSNIQGFVEKPNKIKAQNYLRSGGSFWNSGMFAFKASRIISEYIKYQPALFEICKTSLANSAKEDGCIQIDEASFNICPALSFDKAIMEHICKDKHAKSADVIPIKVGWRDIGTWRSLIGAYKNVLFS